MVDANRTRFLDSRSAFHACVAFAARLKVIVPSQNLYLFSTMVPHLGAYVRAKRAASGARSVFTRRSTQAEAAPI